MSWIRPSVTGPSPFARCAHTTDICGNGKLFVFGGWSGTRMLNDLQIFYKDSMSWNKPCTTGIVPGVRAGHTMTTIETKIYIFGGGDSYQYLNDLHILDTETMAWSQAYVAGTSPAARSRHTTTLIGNRLFVFGGGDDSRVYNDLYILDTNKMSWNRPTTKGNPPSARWGHTANLLENGKLIIFGGHDGNKMLNDIYILDTNTMIWSQPIINQNDKSNLEEPTPRAGHTSTLISKNILLIFGGGDGTKMFNDVWLLNLETWCWSRPQINGNSPPARCAHTATFLDNKLIIFGGGDGGRRFKDLYFLDVEFLISGKKKTILLDHVSVSQKTPIIERTKSLEEKIKELNIWLTNLGMKQYINKFLEQEIYMETLPYLSEHHLEQLGIPTLGARLKLLHAIKELKNFHNNNENNNNDNHGIIEFIKILKDSVLSLSQSTNQLSQLLKQFIPIKLPSEELNKPIICNFNQNSKCTKNGIIYLPDQEKDENTTEI